MKDIPENTNVVTLRDFMNHETRISIVENAIINIDKKFEQVDRRFEHLENKIDSHFKWIIGIMITMFGGLMITKFF